LLTGGKGNKNVNKRSKITTIERQRRKKTKSSNAREKIKERKKGDMK